MGCGGSLDSKESDIHGRASHSAEASQNPLSSGVAAPGSARSKHRALENSVRVQEALMSQNPALYSFHGPRSRTRSLRRLSSVSESRGTLRATRSGSSSRLWQLNTSPKASKVHIKTPSPSKNSKQGPLDGRSGTLRFESKT